MSSFSFPEPNTPRFILAAKTRRATVHNNMVTWAALLKGNVPELTALAHDKNEPKTAREAALFALEFYERAKPKPTGGAS